MKKGLGIIVMIALMGVLAACGNNSSSIDGSSQSAASKEGTSDKTETAQSTSAAPNAAVEPTGLDALKKKGEFVIATTGSYPPYAFHEETAERKLTGFDVELLTDVFSRIDGVKAKFVEVEWDGMLAGLDAGRFDSIHQIGVTEERKLKYDYPDPYLIAYPTLITLEETNDIKGFDGLKGKKVYGSNTSVYGKIAEEKGAVLVPEGESVELLASKRVDAIIFNNLYYLELRKSRPDLKIKAVEQLPDEEQVALPFLKGNDGTVIQAFNKALQAAKDDGTYKELSTKWFGEDVSR